MSAGGKVYPPGALRLIEPDEFRSWILFEDERLLVLNKPGLIVCHPSKHGPRSSLVGAVKEFTGLAAAHLIFRLDRETSGVVVLAKDPVTAARLQRAMERRTVHKRYFVILEGELAGPVRVDQPLGKDVASVVWTKDTVTSAPGSKAAVTLFTPLVARHGFTFAEVRPETGRKHQIRAHAEWLQHRVVGDKVYGPDAQLYVEFVSQGWNEKLAAALPLPRQALHCAEIDFGNAGEMQVFRAPLPEDLRAFCRERLAMTEAELAGT